MFDVIVIGARAAGAPTAMLLARKGYKVLLVDRASFPSDTLSTHQVQLRGVSALQRWGLLDRIMSTNCPPVDHATFTAGKLVIKGKFPPLDGVGVMVCPRRTVLDKILVSAAVESGAELRENFLVERLLFESQRVTGIQGRSKSGSAGNAGSLVEHATLVIGADGKHSMVARAVQAEEYNARPALTCAYYTYWEGLDLDGGQMYSLPQGAVGVWPTNDRLSMIYTAYPIGKFDQVRKNLEASFWNTIDSLPQLAEQVHNGRQADRFYGSGDLPSFYRKSYGPGWALAGDAGMTMDPITGQGIGNAFHDAERLVEAVEKGFSSRQAFESPFAAYEKMRDDETLPMYEFTSQLASFSPPTMEQQVLFSTIAQKSESAGRFLGVFTGSVPVKEFFSPFNLLRIMGIKGIGLVLMSKLASDRKTSPAQMTLE